MKMPIAIATFAAVLVLASSASLSAQQLLFGDGPGSSIGVSIAELKSDQSAKAKLDSGGVLVERVQDGTPAARAGFKSGDVVVEFDGERVRSTRQFVRLVRESPPNRPVKAIVVREGTRQTLDVTPELGRAVFEPSSEIRALVSRPDRLPAPLTSVNPNLPGTFRYFGPQGRLGASISAMSDQLAGYFGVKQGVLVESVEANSPASQAGLKAGDVIIEVNGRTISEPAQLTTAIAAARPGGVDLKVMREKKELTLKATLPEAGLPQLRKRSIEAGPGVI